MCIDSQTIERMMASAYQWTRSFLNEEMNMEVMGYTQSSDNIDAFAVHDTTAIIGVGGLMMAFTFQSRLLDELTDRFTSDIQVPADQREIYRRESAAEIVNIIAGHCTMDMQHSDSVVALSPPVIIDEAKSIQLPRNAVFNSLSISTENGNIDISLVGFNKVLGTQLNLMK